MYSVLRSVKTMGVSCRQILRVYTLNIAKVREMRETHVDQRNKQSIQGSDITAI